MNILFLTTILPIKAKSGGEIVTKQIITGLISSGADVDVVGYVRPDETNLSLPTNYNVAEARVIETQGHKKETLKWLLSSLVKKVPFSSEKYVGAKFIEIVNANLRHCPLYKSDAADDLKRGVQFSVRIIQTKHTRSA
ncbi:hypothetical protein QNH87_25795 [Klebsiella pneumoniae]|uniref:hypothetical protein n=1 Tax=Klebsiella pneumoniae TaxID=573 RepID=UPI00255223D4|nr:hypothetical protein [Klebsiella pneumoniae]MDK9493745.1 hypothetical protein [Klebsiella pneumoniae]